MAAVDRRVGKGAVLQWITQQGTVVTTLNIFPDAGKASLKDEMKTADATAGNDTAEYNISTYRVLGLDVDLMKNVNMGTANTYRLRTGAEGTVRWGWDGTAVGSEKGSFAAILAKWDTDIPFDDTITIKASFKPKGDYVDDPATAQW
jgi:hypothetical protein